MVLRRSSILWVLYIILPYYLLYCGFVLYGVSGDILLAHLRTVYFALYKWSDWSREQNFGLGLNLEAKISVSADLEANILVLIGLDSRGFDLI